MSRKFLTGIDLASHSVVNVTDPVNPQDAVTKNYVSSRLQNLVTNGNGLLGSNNNFSAFTFDAAETHGGGGSFKTAGVASTYKFTDDYIPVDPEKYYRLVAWGKSGDVGGANFDGANRQ